MTHSLELSSIPTAWFSKKKILIITLEQLNNLKYQSMVAFADHRKNQHLADHFHIHHPSLSSKGRQSSTDVPPIPPTAWQEIPIQKPIPPAWKAAWVRGMGSLHLQLVSAFLAGPDGQEEGHGLHKKQASSKEDRNDNFF